MVFSLRIPEIIILLMGSLFILAASYLHWWPITVTEAWGFVTGGICVWLVVREHLWNWPVGLANNILFFILFLRARLYADMSLQTIYFALGIYGWWNWTFGGKSGSPLAITRVSRNEWLALFLAVPLGVWLLRLLLLRLNGAAPFADSLTTILSLAAQYLLSKKRLENWWFWILADCIYIPLYFGRQLPLTAALYAIFLVMCLCGLRQWSLKLYAGGYA
jgi:nicotinamide mononucleotide transporter